MKPETWEALRKRIEDIDIFPDLSDFETYKRGGKTFFRLNKKTLEDAILDSKSELAGCPFGQIIKWIGESSETITGIRGGIILCGDQNWNIDNQAIDLTTNGAWLISISVSCTANTDDDSTLLLPGIQTGTRPTSWSLTAWSEGTDYPSNTAPALPSGDGVIILPLGKLTITDGAADFEPTGCGNFTINHCVGTLSFSR